MPAEPRLTFKLQIDELDEVVRKWSAAHSATSITAAPPGGFNLESLLRGVFDHYEAPTPTYGRLATALHHLGYLLFVNFGEPVVTHPAGFWPKCVRVVRAYANTTYDDRRALISVTAGADPVLIPVPAVPAELLPTAEPSDLRCSRDALVQFSMLVVDRVNLLAPVALAFATATQNGYPSGEIDP